MISRPMISGRPVDASAPLPISILPSQRRTERAGWVSVLSHLDPKYGGLSAVVPELSVAVARHGHIPVTVAGFCAPDEHYRPDIPELKLQHWPLARQGWDTRSRAQFQEIVSSAAGVHVHGLWQYSTSLACRTARELHTPYVLSAHGMLERWALRNKRFKKLLYAALIERKNVQRSDCVHALTTREADDYRRFGVRGPIAVVPNGVDVPTDASPDQFLEQFPGLRGKQLVLFLGRIHFKKGLDILCQAWAQIASRFPDAHLVLAGPDFEGTVAKVQQLVESLGLTSRVTFTGMLAGDLKWSALRSAHCFVLPSYSEGLSVSTLEAMGMGLPVIVTRQCNLPEVAEKGCGCVIDAAIGPLEEALRHILSCHAMSWLSMSRAGLELVEERYSWNKVGEQMADVYRWVAAGRPPEGVPASVILEPAKSEIPEGAER